VQYSSNRKFEESVQILLQTPWQLMKGQINLIGLKVTRSPMLDNIGQAALFTFNTSR